MEFLDKSSKAKLKHILETVMDKIGETDEDLYNSCYTLIEEHLYEIPLETAQEIVCKMIPCGEVYSYDAIKDFLKKHNNYDESTEPHNSIDYYLVMNMFQNDFKSVLEKYGMANNNLFCYELSKSFIEDEDGGDYKVSKYFLMLK
jgi:hypothetical protein